MSGTGNDPKESLRCMQLIGKFNMSQLKCLACGNYFMINELHTCPIKPSLANLANRDNVNHPSHYNDGKIEVIEFIEDKSFSYHRGNAIKYLARAGKKDPNTKIEDLKKAIWYIQREIELEGLDPRKPNEMNQKENKNG